MSFVLLALTNVISAIYIKFLQAKKRFEWATEQTILRYVLLSGASFRARAGLLDAHDLAERRKSTSLPVRRRGSFSRRHSNTTTTRSSRVRLVNTLLTSAIVAVHFNSVRARHRHARGLRPRALSTALASLNRRLSLWILSTRMFPAIVTAVPLFLMMRDVRLLNTRVSLIIVYTGFQSAVRRLDDARFLRRPAARSRRSRARRWRLASRRARACGVAARAPGLAATAVFCLIVSWNEFLFALVLTQTDAAMTLPVGIAGRVTQYEIKWGVMSAAASVAIVPILVFALALQKYLVRGLSLGAVQGLIDVDRVSERE
jgi:ABC-type spermidine/putrescine transport system permease subunit II